jgi:hypothetical protein
MGTNQAPLRQCAITSDPSIRLVQAPRAAPHQPNKAYPGPIRGPAPGRGTVEGSKRGRYQRGRQPGGVRAATEDADTLFDAMS